MIKPISFYGTVKIEKKIKDVCRPDEIEKIQKFADSQNCDFTVYDRTAYPDNTGVYYTIRQRKDDFHLYEQVFDFKYPRKGSYKLSQMPPEYY